LTLAQASRAACWRLTELGYLKQEPTRDFLRWNGAPYVPETGDTPCRESGTLNLKPQFSSGAN
jgi:hypothetical protein